MGSIIKKDKVNENKKKKKVGLTPYTYRNKTLARNDRRHFTECEGNI